MFHILRRLTIFFNVNLNLFPPNINIFIKNSWPSEKSTTECAPVAYSWFLLALPTSFFVLNNNSFALQKREDIFRKQISKRVKFMIFVGDFYGRLECSKVKLNENIYKSYVALCRDCLQDQLYDFPHFPYTYHAEIGRYFSETRNNCVLIFFRRYQTDPVRGLTDAKAKANLGRVHLPASFASTYFMYFFSPTRIP